MPLQFSNVWDCQDTQQTPSGRATGSQVQWGFFPHSGFMLKWWQAFTSSDPAEVPLTKTMREWHHPISTHLAQCPCLCTHSSCEKYTCIEFLNHLMVMMMLIIHPFIHPFILSCLPAVFGRRRGYTLDNFPVLLKAHLKRQKTFLITLTPTAKLELPIHLTCLFLEQSESRRRDTDTD